MLALMLNNVAIFDYNGITRTVHVEKVGMSRQQKEYIVGKDASRDNEYRTFNVENMTNVLMVHDG